MYVPAIQENIDANEDTISSNVAARHIDWNDDVPEDLRNQADTVFVCDCVYYEASLDPLIKTVCDLLKPRQESLVILAYERRADKVDIYTEFFDKVKKLFLIEEVLNEKLKNKNDVFLLKMKLRLWYEIKFGIIVVSVQ